MEDKTFDELLYLNCYSESQSERDVAAELLEFRYSCEINCPDIDKSVLFAHHARGCTIIAAKICADVVIMQNVTIGSNQRYNKLSGEWENLGTPIIDEGVVIADGAKVLGPIIIGKNTVIGAGSLVTKDIPADSVVYGVNKYRPKDQNYDLVFAQPMPSREQLISENEQRVAQFDKKST